MKLLEIIKDSLLENYRESDYLNYSLLKEIVSGNISSIRDGIPQTTSTYMDFGTYIDKTIEKGEEPNVYIYKHVELTGHSKILADELVKRNIGLISSQERLDVADELDLWSTTKKKDARLKKVNNSDITTILMREDARSAGLDVISNEDLKLAKYILNVLYTHEYSKEIINPTLKIEPIKQLSLKFKFNGVDCKVLLDILNIDHKNKIISPYDLKTGSKKNFLDNFYKYKYWIQATLYYLAIINLQSKYKELKDYKIDNFKFLYISRERSDTPLVYEVSSKAIEKYTEGYWKDENWQKGLVDYIEDYKFHKETNIYDQTREEYENKGVVTLPIPC